MRVHLCVYVHIHCKGASDEGLQGVLPEMETCVGLGVSIVRVSKRGCPKPETLKKLLLDGVRSLGCSIFEVNRIGKV